ncbi:MAG: hypothetical protein ACOH5I_14105 [Oligoflexus sp.]
MEYTSDKNFNRQRICMKCKSFITPDKIDESRLSCPLCGHHMPTTPSINKPIGIQEFRMLLAQRFRKENKTED